MNFLKYLFFLFVVKPFVYVVLGINVKNPQNLPKKGPAILVANHNSHVDTLVLMSLFQMEMINKVNPVAAADYFFNTKMRRLIFKTLLGAIPINRVREGFSRENIFAGVNEALENEHILIIYPEGTRSMDSEIHEFKAGVAHLAKSNPEVPVIPIFINGPDRILPKYDNLLVPFICDIYVGEAVRFGQIENGDKKVFTQKIQDEVMGLKAEHTKTHKQL